jgi:hypothetical protein
MSGPVAYPILYNSDPFHNSYGIITLNAGTAHVDSSSILATSKILLTRLNTGSNPAGAVGFSNLRNGIFTVRSTSATDDGRLFYLILKPTSEGWPQLLPISLPIINLGETIGQAHFTNGTVTVNKASCRSTSSIFIGRVLTASNNTLTNAQCSFSAITNGSFTLTSSSSTDNGYFNYLILTPASDYPDTLSVGTFIPPLVSAPSDMTYGQVALVSGNARVNTTASRSANETIVFVSKASSEASDTTQTYYVKNISDGFFDVESTSGLDNATLNWWLINASV